MLDTKTKRRIDTARDILVGKVPDPKSQVEQITIALIYKFMDDLDAESEEFGGKRKFFAGEFARFGWAKLMRSGLGGHDTLNLYTEAIKRMPENPGIPPLFRDIFKNAYLPYNDPETLRAFLKVIDEFIYDHSERLGDAFEYLLSVLGSQGDAGQFRTPRHIIDFIVAVIDPKKGESVLDPACGTAGFLISSYKHILAANIDDKGHGTLTPDDKERLAANFKGYDISPDMVRLSLVNMYLHGFADPHIFEYDTLTSEERWNEYADVILANPPFMSPKGGIRPHNRFSVQSKRSEVLFVDYMAEHLTPSGRAGIIVPEGIIFQSQTVYKQLRKMLVENFLVAVVSLPAGVFQPYSGVKTSILILDKSLAKRADRIAFFKVENDGFDLGAQRRSIDKNDLPQVKAEITEYLRLLRAGESKNNFEPTLGLITEKGKIAENGEYNLSGERYRENAVLSSSYPMVAIGAICDLINGRAFKPSDWEDSASGGLPIVRIQNLNDLHSGFNYYTGEVSDRHVINEGQLLFSWSGSRGTSFGAHIWNGEKAVLNQHIFKVGVDKARATKMYLFYALNKAVAQVEENLHGGVGLVHITKGNLEKIEIPLPPLEVQREIVAEIEGYQKVIDGARAVIDNYRPHIPIDSEWPMVELRDVCKLISGQHIDKSNYNMNGKGIGYLTGPADFGGMYARVSKWTTKPKVFAEKGDILITVKGSGLGKVNFLSMEKAAISRQLMAIRVHDAVPEFVYSSLVRMYGQIQKLGGGAAIPGITRDDVLRLTIPLPSLEVQHTIVAGLESEQVLVAANRDLIERFERKTQATIARVWGEDAPASLAT